MGFRWCSVNIFWTLSIGFLKIWWSHFKSIVHNKWCTPVFLYNARAQKLKISSESIKTYTDKRIILPLLIHYTSYFAQYSQWPIAKSWERWEQLCQNAKRRGLFKTQGENKSHNRLERHFDRQAERLKNST